MALILGIESSCDENFSKRLLMKKQNSLKKGKLKKKSLLQKLLKMKFHLIFPKIGDISSLVQ